MSTPTEIGRTVRAAIKGWPETFRLCLLVAVAATTLGVLFLVTHT